MSDVGVISHLSPVRADGGAVFRTVVECLRDPFLGAGVAGWKRWTLFRSAVLVRDAAVDDLESLRTIFGTDSGPELDEKPGEGACAIASIAADPDQRLVVAGHDGRVVGAAHLVRAPLSPLQSAMAVHVAHLHVLEGSRRRGVGTALIEAAVSWAEEKDTDHVLVAASVELAGRQPVPGPARPDAARGGAGRLGHDPAGEAARRPAAGLPAATTGTSAPSGRSWRAAARCAGRRSRRPSEPSETAD